MVEESNNHVIIKTTWNVTVSHITQLTTITTDTTFLFSVFYIGSSLLRGARGSVVGWGTMLQAGRSPVRIPEEVDFFNLPNPSSHTMALGSTQPLTEMSTRKFPGGKKSGRRVGLTTLPPFMSRMSENVGASTSRNPEGLQGLYGDNFTFTFSPPQFHPRNYLCSVLRPGLSS
jgi:hypothetical protein